MIKVLQLCPKPPLPPVDGGCLAMHSVTRGLIACGAKVKVFALATEKHPFKSELIPAEFLKETGFVHVSTSTRVTFPGMVRSFIRNTPYVLDRFEDPEARQKLCDLLEEESFDIIQAEGLFVSDYLDIARKYSKAPVVFRSHNIEHAIWESRSEKSRGLRRPYLRYMAKLLKEAEIKAWNDADAVISISPADTPIIRRYVNPDKVFTVPFALDISQLPEAAIEKDTVFHLGSMDWEPNREGVSWFIREVWPLVVAAYPQAKLHLAGKAISANDVPSGSRNIFVDGEVASAPLFMAHKEVMIVPLFTGSGVRVKLLEGMASAKPVVSTTKGAEGCSAKASDHYLVADDAAGFAQAVIRLLKDKSAARATGERARQYVRENHDLKKVSQYLMSIYQNLSDA